MMLGMEVLPYVVIAGAVLLWALLSKRSHNAAHTEVASKLGVTAKDGTLSGEILGYDVSLRAVPREVSEGVSGYSTRLKLKLWTAPKDLLVTRVNAMRYGYQSRSKTPQLDVSRFDSVFRIACDNVDGAVAWVRLRDHALTELHRIADFVELEGGELSLELAVHVETAEELEALLLWGAEIAARLDTPTAEDLPPTPVTLRGRTLREVLRPGEHPSRYGRSTRSADRFMFKVMTVPASFLILWLVISIYAPTCGQQSSQPTVSKEDLFIDCVTPHIGQPHDEWSECEMLKASYESKPVRDAYIAMRQTQAHYDARINLDAVGAREALVAMTGDLALDASEMGPLFWAYGLIHDYRVVVREDVYQRDAYPYPALSVLESEPYFESERRAEFRRAYLCMIDSAESVYYAPSPILGEMCGTKKGRGQSVGAVEAMTDGRVILSGERLDHPDAVLLRYVRQVTFPVEEGAEHRRPKPVDDPVEVAAKLPPLRCGSPWYAEKSMGDPARLLAAAEIAEVPEPLAERLRLFAARQYAVLGDKAAALEALTGIADEATAICAAQLETGLGEPGAALERLATLSEPHEGHVALATAQAHLLQGSWKLAHRSALEAMLSLPPRASDVSRRQTQAALVATAAAAQLNVPDGLDEYFGEAGEVEQNSSDPIAVTRWFGLAKRSGEPLAQLRWRAPKEIPLERGAEAAQLLAAGVLAEENVEYWLDVLWPEEFDPYGVTIGRRIAAQLREDHDAVAQWEKAEAAQRALIKTARDARLYRYLRSLD